VIDAEGTARYYIEYIYIKDWKSEGCSIFGEYMYDNGLPELNPEKPEGGERSVDGNILINQRSRAKSEKNLRKGVKNAKDKISHI
jgi:hypothetical protein